MLQRLIHIDAYYGNVGSKGGNMPRILFYHHSETGESGTSTDVSGMNEIEIFSAQFEMLNKAQPGWDVIDSHDDAEMARIQFVPSSAFASA